MLFFYAKRMQKLNFIKLVHCDKNNCSNNDIFSDETT